MKYVNPKITVYRRTKDGRPQIQVVGWKATKNSYTFRGPITFITIACRVEGMPRPRKKVKKAKWSSLRRILRLGTKTV